MSSKVNTLPTLYKAGQGFVVQWRVWVEPGPHETGYLCIEFGQVGGKMQSLREHITDGKNAGKKNATTGLSQAVAEATSRWNKQKDRKGYGLTAAESKAVRSVSPMLAKKYEDHAKKVDWRTAVAQRKLDGFRATIRSVRGQVTIMSRENQPLRALEHIADAFKSVDIDEGVALDGELYCHGMSLNEISSACKAKKATTERIHYHAYDAVMPAPFLDRLANANTIIDAVNSEFVQKVETIKVRNETELLAAQAEFLDEGYEGAMLRHGSEVYEAGKRSVHLLKVKAWQDDEFRIVDFKLGRGKYAGMPIYICVTEQGHNFDVLAYGTLEQKRTAGADAMNAVGKHVKVRYAYYTKTDEPVPFLPVAIGFPE